MRETRIAPETQDSEPTRAGIVWLLFPLLQHTDRERERSPRSDLVREIPVNLRGIDRGTMARPRL
jgi:hypothetical protein